MYKLVRHFRATKVFLDTARKCFDQLIGILTLMLGLVILFAIILYQIENGVTCFVGDPGCVVPPPPAGSLLPVPLRLGDRVVLNKLGGLSQIPDVFYGLWFSFVTLTTTGYGDIVPVTNAGRVMTVFLMLAGSCYLSMPLTVCFSKFDIIRNAYYLYYLFFFNSCLFRLLLQHFTRYISNIQRKKKLKTLMKYDVIKQSC